MTERISGGQTEQEVFARFFPDAQINNCAIADIPKAALAYFECKSHQFVNRNEYVPGNFTRLMSVVHSDGNKTYLAVQTKTYTSNKDTEELTYLVDTDQEGLGIGYGEIRKRIYGKRKFFKDKPFVGDTFTKEENRSTGLGGRRLLIMNAICQILYQLPLYSDTLMSKEARSLWENLAALGKAKMQKEGKADRFVLTSP